MVGRTGPVRACRANEWTLVADVAALARELGWSWEVAGERPAWVLEAGGHRLEVTPGDKEALLDGKPYALLYSPRPPLGASGEKPDGGCMVALRDLESLVALKVDSNWREGYLTVE